MDFIDTNGENLYSMDTVITKMRDFAKLIDSNRDVIDSSCLKKIAEAINILANMVKIVNEVAVEQAKKDAIDDFVAKLKDRFGGEK